MKEIEHKFCIIIELGGVSTLQTEIFMNEVCEQDLYYN
jgi:hypothetical protein